MLCSSDRIQLKDINETVQQYEIIRELNINTTSYMKTTQGLIKAVQIWNKQGQSQPNLIKKRATYEL